MFCVIITIIIAMKFNEIEEAKDKKEQNNSIQNVKQGFLFIFNII